MPVLRISVAFVVGAVIGAGALLLIQEQPWASADDDKRAGVERAVVRHVTRVDNTPGWEPTGADCREVDGYPDAWDCRLFRRGRVDGWRVVEQPGGRLLFLDR
jgi:hypothetical protein